MSSRYPSAELTNEAREVARSRYGLEPATVESLAGGRVNDTFLVVSPRGRFILQRLNDFFHGHESLGLNWRQVRQALADRAPESDLPLPPVLADDQGRCLARTESGGFWRLTGFRPGRPAEKNPADAREAAGLLGWLHRRLNAPAPLELLPLPAGEFTNQHLTRPEDFLKLETDYRGHPHLDDLRPFLEKAAEAAWRLPLIPGYLKVFGLREVVIHGDPKADNFLFNGPRAAFLLDWDSVGLGHALVDLAEMMRSFAWSAPDFSEEIAVSLLEGYGRSGLELDREELALLPAVLRGIALNLTRRYFTDALAEVYFKWDEQKYPSLFQQNLTRGSQLLALEEEVLGREFALIRNLEAAYGRGRNR